jgi:hypothetical protein
MPLSSLRLYCEKWGEQLGGNEQVCGVWCVVLLCCCAAVLCVSVCAY